MPGIDWARTPPDGQVTSLHSFLLDLISPQVNKDYLKKIKLFRARAAPAYCAVAFEQSQDVENDDPM